MAFDSTEKSSFSGRPEEFYLFQIVGSAEAFRYTPMRLPISYQGFEYTPKAIQRGNYTFKKDVATGDSLSIDVQSDLPLLDHFKIIVPRRTMRVTIFRRHRSGGDLEVMPVFIGRVRGVSWEGPKATIECDSMNAMAKRGGLTANYQVPCNYFLYSAPCGVAEGDWREVAIIQAIDNGTTITSPTFATKPDGFYKYGFLETTDGSYMITSHVGDKITLLNGLEGISAGQSVNVYAGCDRTLDTCWDRFNNGLNHLGFKWSPADNAFVEGI